MLQALALISVALIGLGILRKPVLGLYGLLLVITLIPNVGVIQILDYRLTPVDLFMVSFALLWVLYKGVTGKGIKRSPLLAPIVLIVLGRFLSIFATPSLIVGSLVAFLRYLEWLLVFLIVIDLARRQDVLNLMFLFLGVIGIQSVISIAQFGVSLRATGGHYATRGGTLGITGAILAWLQIYAILISRSLVYYAPAPWQRKWWWLYLGLVIVGLLTMLARSALVTLVIGLLCFEFFDHRCSFITKFFRIGKVIGVAGLALGLVLAINELFFATVIARLQTLVNLQESFTVQIRLILWHAGIQMFLEHPLIGVGTGNFVDLQRSFIDPDQISLYGIYGRTTHNAIINILSENGLIGILFYLPFAVKAVVMVRADLKRLKTSDLYPSLLPLGSAIVAMLIADWFTWTSFSVWSMFFLAIYASLRKAAWRADEDLLPR